MPTSAQSTYSAAMLQPVYNAEDALQQNVTLLGSSPAIAYAAGQVLAELVGNNEVQTVTISATGGTFTITFGGQTTTAIAYNASAATVQTALELLSSIGTGNIAVTGSAGGPYTLTFQNALGNQNVAQVTTGAGSLTGGSGTATPATVTAGSAGTPGTFVKYNSDATDGSQKAKCLLTYGVSVDNSGNITVPGEWGETLLGVPVYFSGAFKVADLVGLTESAVSDLGGHLINGAISNANAIVAF